jgi:predicted Ser/Thr protein kinase
VQMSAHDTARPQAVPGRRFAFLALVGLFSVALPIVGWFVATDSRGAAAATVAAIEQASFLVAGAILLWKTPTSRVGALLYLIGLLDVWALGVHSDIPAIDTVAWVMLGTSDIVLIVLVLTYPSGHFEDRLDRWFATAAVGFLVSTWLIELVSAEPALFGCEMCLQNPFRFIDPSLRLWWGGSVMTYAIPLGAVALGLLVFRRWRRTTRPARVRLTPLLAIGLAAAVVGTVDVMAGPGRSAFGEAARLVGPLVRATIPIALALGLLRMWHRRLLATGRVASIAPDLDSAALGPTVASVLGDPGATILHWSPTQGGYVDDSGRVTPLPVDPASYTLVREGDELLAAIVHDPALADDRTLLATVGGAVRLALIRERLRQAVRYETADEGRTGLQAGEMIGGFRIIRPLGRGGMGLVYLAEDDVLGRRVAVKVLAPSIAADPGFRERFLREARSAASLDHPNVVTVLAAGEDAGRLYLVMRYIDGPDLQVRIRTEGPVAPDRAVQIVAGIASALDAAHAIGIVHRDVKTSNILLEDRMEHPFLADFGLARPVATGSTLTHAGGFVGSIDTMSPERIRGEPAGPAADIYALGCVLHESLVGRAPFARDSELATLWAHLQTPVPLPSADRPGVPKAFDAVVARALAKDPQERYVTAGALAAAAREAVSG